MACNKKVVFFLLTPLVAYCCYLYSRSVLEIIQTTGRFTANKMIEQTAWSNPETETKYSNLETENESSNLKTEREASYPYTDKDRPRKWSNKTEVTFLVTERTVCDQVWLRQKVTFTLKEYTRIGWQEVIPRLMYVYSAHQDPVVTDVLTVHVVGQIADELLDQKWQYISQDLYCQLWQDPGGLVAITTTFAFSMCTPAKSSVGMRMKCVFNTTIPTSSNQNVIAIVSGDKCQRPSNLLRIQNVLADNITDPDNFRICVGSPMRRNYSDYQRFAEYMELNEILGSKQTTLYYHDSTDLTRKFVEYYAAERGLDVVPWEMPWNVLPEGRVEGQQAVLQDCALKNALRTQYVGEFDLDESIIPQGDAYTWSDMIARCNCTHKSVVVARHALFHRNRNDDIGYGKSPVLQTLQPQILMKSIRNVEVLPGYARAKCIFKPEKVKAVNYHVSPLRPELGEKACNMGPDIALMHHYRAGGTPNFNKFLNESVVTDRTAHKYTGEIIARLLKVYGAVLNFTGEM